MIKPSTVAMDANACIIHALHLDRVFGKPLHHIDCKFVRSLVEGCACEKIRVGAFKTAEDESYRNITRATNQFAEERGVQKKYYPKRKFNDEAAANLKKLFLKLEKFPERFDENDLAAAETFFRSCNKQIPTYTNPQKSSIPGRADLIQFVSAHNLDPSIVHILSNDAHFIGYSSEIEKSAYTVRVLPVPDLPAMLVDWKWRINS